MLSETGLSHTRHRHATKKINCYQESGVKYSYLYAIRVFFSGISSSPWILDRPKSSLSMQGYVEATGIYDGI